MIRGDKEDVASLLASIVDGLDGLVGGSDGLDGGIVDTSVTNLEPRQVHSKRTSQFG